MPGCQQLNSWPGFSGFMYNWVMIRIRVRIIKVKIIILKCKTLPPAIKVVSLVIYINTLEYHFNLFSLWVTLH